MFAGRSAVARSIGAWHEDWRVGNGVADVWRRETSVPAVPTKRFILTWPLGAQVARWSPARILGMHVGVLVGCRVQAWKPHVVHRV